MKTRMFILLVVVLALSAAVVTAQTSGKTCCSKSTKAAIGASSATHATFMTVGDKKVATKSTAHAEGKSAKAECSKDGQCDMSKAAMKKADGKMDCCQGKSAKSTKAEKKVQSDKSEGKGTN